MYAQVHTHILYIHTPHTHTTHTHNLHTPHTYMHTTQYPQTNRTLRRWVKLNKSEIVKIYPKPRSWWWGRGWVGKHGGYRGHIESILSQRHPKLQLSGPVLWNEAARTLDSRHLCALLWDTKWASPVLNTDTYTKSNKTNPWSWRITYWALVSWNRNGRPRWKSEFGLMKAANLEFPNWKTLRPRQSTVKPPLPPLLCPQWLKRISYFHSQH